MTATDPVNGNGTGNGNGNGNDGTMTGDMPLSPAVQLRQRRTGNQAESS